MDTEINLVLIHAVLILAKDRTYQIIPKARARFKTRRPKGVSLPEYIINQTSLKYYKSRRKLQNYHKARALMIILM